MQKLVTTPAYPKALPEPTLRKGGLTYEIRVRVPPQARGGRFNGSHTTRSLGTRDKAEALRRLPHVYSTLQAEFDTEAAQLASASQKSVAPATSSVTDPTLAAPVKSLPFLSVDEACQLYREYILEGERRTRQEDTESARRNVGRSADGRGWDTSRGWNPVELAAAFRKRLDRALDVARARAIVHDYSHPLWFVRLLESDGRGVVRDHTTAVREMARTEVQTLRQIIEDDEGLLPSSGSSPPSPQAIALLPTASGAPKLSEFVEKYIAKRGAGLSSERADTIKATVRDLIAVVGDKAIDTYTSSDAEAFEDVMLSLPSNWNKRQGLRGLSIKDAVAKAALLGLPKQAPKTIRKKWTILCSVFKNAAIKHQLLNPFVAAALVIDDGGAANSDWDTFTPEELTALLSSDLPGRLYWLTWLGLYTGARLNELCQLNKTHIRHHNGLHYIYFSPELRLKTGEKESCIRAVPIHDALIDRGLLNYVATCVDLLFPGIPQHKTGRFSDAPSKAFSRHLKNIGLKRKALSFQSLRHTFVAAFKRCAPRDAESRERLVGHAVSGVAGRYGDSYEAEAHDMVLLKARAQILNEVKF